jgi:tetratricopeptide (TPR) repeat protein
VGRAVKTRALILGSVRRFGEAYSLELRGLDPKSDQSLFAVSEQVSRKEDVPALIDRVSDRARRALRERDDDLHGARVEMGEAVTKNLDAYQHYFRGMECTERPREDLEWYGCSDEFRAAVKADPNFALAHYQLAYLGNTINVSGSAQVDRAFIDSEIDASLRDERQLPARERSRALALKAHLAGDDTAALRRYDDLIRRYPDDKHALYLAGNLLYDRSDYAGAVPYLQKATELDPFFENAVRSLVHALGKLQRKEELRALLDRWSHLPQNPALRGAVVRGAVWLGDLDRALAEAHANASAATDPSPLLDLAAVQFSRAEFIACQQTLRRAIQAFPEHSRLEFMLPSALSAQGRQREALESLSAAFAKRPLALSGEEHVTRARILLASQSASAVWSEVERVHAPAAEIAATLAADMALLGDVRRAAELKDHLLPHTPDRELAEAVLTWRAGDAAGALARLKALDALEPNPEWGLPPSYVIAEVASTAGEDTAVLEAARRFRTIWSHLGSRGGWTVPRMVFLEARSLARLGRTGEARRALDRLLVETTNADSDAPLTREARILSATIDKMR